MSGPRNAVLDDVTEIARLCLGAAQVRAMENPALWALPSGPIGVLREALVRVIGVDAPPMDQHWQIGDAGAIRSALLPVPPIYAGHWGKPGLMQPDAAATGDPDSLIAAAEAYLSEAGARVLLGAARPGDDWEAAYIARGYDTVTLYYARSGLDGGTADACLATEDDIDAIVADSAVNRAVLADLDAFWTTHPEADARFGAWMKTTLKLTDRDLRVGADGRGYVIAQPAGPLHVPPPHPTDDIGFIDDWFHPDLASRDGPVADDSPALDLLRAAESDLAARGRDSALVVCAAKWGSRRRALERVGYQPALVWLIRRPDES